LLEQLGLTFTVIAPNVDESPLAGEGPIAYVGRVALDKVNAVVTPDALAIAADTTVELDGEIIAKPVDLDDARVMLRRLSGRTHAVHTGVALRRDDRCVSATVTSLVTFVTLSEAGIEWYVATGEPLDKAGAYAIQGAGAVLVHTVEGSVSNIIGLPLPNVIQLARQLDVDLLAAR
jgi:septum formation protein